MIPFLSRSTVIYLYVQKGIFFTIIFLKACDQSLHSATLNPGNNTMPMTAYTTVQEQYYFGHSSLEAHCVVEILTFETFVGIVDGLARALCGNERGPLVSL